ncbi:hypothetical protein [Oceanobacillus senegalensis]|uniref:hypothetical protein n=1 Tax=Oceanobacillus senegalensis TaxID=1936063 RepID=UPI0015C46572|nr:hypothetical protein [Oceanobacillus senegalensis]
MESNKGIISEKNVNEEEHSLKGALFSSVVFVGGTIVACILLLLVLYMIRI